jgi:DNA mismatch repair ATPase MutS
VRQTPVKNQPSADSKLAEELRSVQPDELSPRDALEMLYRLKAILRDNEPGKK